MFVSPKIMARIAAVVIIVAGGNVPALASNMTISDTVPLTISLSRVQGGEAPLYISVQRQNDYMTQKGEGVILKETRNGTMSVVIDIPLGEHAISIWHDLDKDGKFSMNEYYQPTDGWGSSGKTPTKRRPNFDDVKVTINKATTVDIAILYPPQS